ncbi:hypothetical protein ONZ45_g3071 [Pleurotus djamor]|nr:hypothetical protein ONZ45_g3071 [Pleurotus djamor]
MSLWSPACLHFQDDFHFGVARADRISHIQAFSNFSAWTSLASYISHLLIALLHQSTLSSLPEKTVGSADPEAIELLSRMKTDTTVNVSRTFDGDMNDFTLHLPFVKLKFLPLTPLEIEISKGISFTLLPAPLRWRRRTGLNSKSDKGNLALVYLKTPVLNPNPARCGPPKKFITSCEVIGEAERTVIGEDEEWKGEGYDLLAE